MKNTLATDIESIRARMLHRSSELSQQIMVLENAMRENTQTSCQMIIDEIKPYVIGKWLKMQYHDTTFFIKPFSIGSICSLCDNIKVYCEHIAIYKDTVTYIRRISHMLAQVNEFANKLPQYNTTIEEVWGTAQAVLQNNILNAKKSTVQWRHDLPRGHIDYLTVNGGSFTSIRIEREDNKEIIKSAEVSNTNYLGATSETSSIGKKECVESLNTMYAILQRVIFNNTNDKEETV